MAKPLATLLSMLTPKRRWAQFSLATMFVVVTVLCLSLSVVVNRAHRQRDAVAAIKSLGGWIAYAEPGQQASEAFPRSILQRWLSRDYFDDVRKVYIAGPQVTDAALKHFATLTSLQELLLDDTQVTGDGLENLERLTMLEVLSLGDTRVTDDGLENLEGLTRLESLWLNGTQVTDAGLAHLQELTGLKHLSLTATHVTDAGLIHLHELTELKWVSFGDTQVTDAGLVELRQALPMCQIIGP